LGTKGKQRDTGCLVLNDVLKVRPHQSKREDQVFCNSNQIRSKETHQGRRPGRDSKEGGNGTPGKDLFSRIGQGGVPRGCSNLPGQCPLGSARKGDPGGREQLEEGGFHQAAAISLRPTTPIWGSPLSKALLVQAVYKGGEGGGTEGLKKKRGAKGPGRKKKRENENRSAWKENLHGPRYSGENRH